VTELFLSCGLVLALDQWSKHMVRMRDSDPCAILGQILLIRRVTHFKDIYSRDAVRTILVAVWLAALLSAVALHQSGITFKSELALVGLGAALGGAAGNLFDILRYRGICDFIDLRCWPIFNLADVGIVCGLVIAFWPRS
jgi:signal peptidase II